jgi:ABC-type sugar transport system ATPase subunit
VTEAPRIELRGIRKAFPGVQALDGVDLVLYEGEVHALVGENGAGKSTLIKVIGGVYRADEGTYLIDGKPNVVSDPRSAADAGIRVVHQELEQVPDLSIAENVFFGRLPVRGGIRVDWRRLEQDTRAVLDQVGLDVSPRVKVRRLGIAQQQLVEIARALSHQARSLTARVLVLDEPTSALSPAEIDGLFVLLRQLRDAGVAMLYVSHKLDEIRALADCITILRDGTHVSTDEASDLDEREIIRRMVGRQLDGAFPRSQRTAGDVALAVDGLTTEHVRDISLSVRSGEVVGVSGLMGAGRTELLRGILGADRRLAGRVRVRGKTLGADATWRARAAGLGLVPEDRRAQGIFPLLGVMHNASIACLRQFSRTKMWLQAAVETRETGRVVERMRVRTPSLQQPVALLSGGNQQKVLLARWLLKRDMAVLFVDEPTRGIDVGARFEIYRLLDELACEGLGILLVSSEMKELLGLCDRICVMKGGRITEEMTTAEASQERLLAAAL